VNGLGAEQLSSNGPRLVFVHGFTQTRESWRPLAERFVADHEVVIVDAPHHGSSSHIEADFDTSSSLLADAVDGGTLVGYSMGGRLALLAALGAPDRVRALVLVSATPGMDDPRERAERRDADNRLATEVERLGTAVFLQKWLNQPMFAHFRPTEADLNSRLQNPAAALARSLRMCGTGVQEPLWNRLADLTVPTLIVCGESDQKFTAIGTRMLAALPQARFEIIEGAGHAPHLEQPEAFAAMLREWLDELSR
jgi:2-succinyl-6-hydroxy-2,4-cyclohexadiene-1-carboxylate synthase